MEKVYKISLVGFKNYGVLKPLYFQSENVKAHNKAEAEERLKTLSEKYSNVWSTNIEFNFKETVKLFILNMLGLESIKLETKKKNGKEKE